jgi:hypothetical protein
MWCQPPPPVDDRWVLHIAVSPHQVDDVLGDLCIHKRARPLADPDYPAYLTGRESPYEPPAWMSFACAELNRRGYSTKWCDPRCAHHPWPPRTDPPASPDGRSPHARRAPGRRASGTAVLQLTAGVPHHRTAHRMTNTTSVHHLS